MRLLEILHEDVRQAVSMVQPERLTWRPVAKGPTVAELMGLLLLDLDGLSSGPQNGRYPLPPFATEYMNKRLARRLTDRYPLQDLQAEFDRRFAAARDAVVEGRDGDALETVVERMDVRLTEIRSALRSRNISSR